MSFISIHNHVHTGSNLRFRDCIIKPKELIEYAHELGHKGVIITDHESITAHMECLEYYDSIKDNPDYSGFTLGLGNEIYLCPSSVTAENKNTNIYPHFILIACDAEGHKGIRELSTKAWIKNSFMHVSMRVPTYYANLEEMMQKYKGHIIGSSGCLGGSLPRHLLQYQVATRSFPDTDSQQTWKECVEWIEYMKDIFGDGYFFLELQPGLTEEQIYVNQQLVKLSEETNVDYIISLDSHYLRKEDRDIHAAFLNAGDGDRETAEFYESTYMMSENEIHERMDSYLGSDAVQKGIDNTMLIYNKLTYYTLKKPLHIPYIPLKAKEPNKTLYQKYKDKVPLYQELYKSKYDSDRHLLSRLLDYMEKDEWYRSDLAYEKIDEALDYLLRSSNKNNVRWSAYLLQMADYIDICWETGSVVGAGRGSGVGFCLLHMLGITQICPWRETTKTYPARFLNPDRVSVLDIDTDVNPIYRDVIIDKMKEVYGQDKVSKVLTIQTEKSRSAILAAGRSLGLDNDLVSYIASLVVFDRGNPRSLHTMYYGNDEHAPVYEFVREMDEHSDLWEIAQKIEGLCSGMGSHAGGVIIADEPLTNSTALMRTNSGDIITQYDLHKCEDVSLIKIDLLATDAVAKIQECLNLLLNAGKIEWQGNLRDTYERYIGIYTLERESEDMWKMVWEHKVISFFQMEKQSGKQALALVKPKSVDDLATINSVIRLMAQEQGAETPLQKYARFHNDIQLWYDEMKEAGLTEEEQEVLKSFLLVSSGICEAQEYLMFMSMHPMIGGFDLNWADSLRKAVGKKSVKDFDRLEKEFFQNAKEKGLSKNLVNYVWNTLFKTQRGYGFNKSHTLSYSLIGLQELNLCYKYNILYWSAANLIVDSGANDSNANEGTNYGKIGVAISKMQQENVIIANPDISTAEFSFLPDEASNQIIYALKAINSINTEIAQTIIQNRPYNSMDDFATRMLDTGVIKNSQMLMLIKAGCFLNFHSKDRAETMKWYLTKYKLSPVEKLTLAQLKSITEYDIVPDDLKLCMRYINFKKYVLDDEGFVEYYRDPNKKLPQCGYHDRYFILDEESQKFFKEHFTEDSVIKVQGSYYIISEKKFTKEVDVKIQPLKEWFVSDEAVKAYNDAQFKAIWNQYALGNEAHWSMQSLTCYDDKHELDGIRNEMYGVVDYFSLPETPEVYDIYTRYINGERKKMPKYTILRLAGTVLNADNNHHTVSLLTTTGVVNVKFPKGQYAFYNRRISQLNETGVKKLIEDSWFKRGTLLIVAGIRQDDMFRAMNYSDTIYKHSCERILEVRNDGTLLLQAERANV